MVRDVPHKPLGALKTPCELRGHLLHQYEPSWNVEKSEVGGDALGPDTTRLHSSQARACKNLTIHDLDRRCAGGGEVPRQEQAVRRQESQARRQEEATR